MTTRTMHQIAADAHDWYVNDEENPTCAGCGIVALPEDRSEFVRIIATPCPKKFQGKSAEGGLEETDGPPTTDPSDDWPPASVKAHAAMLAAKYVPDPSDDRTEQGDHNRTMHRNP